MPRQSIISSVGTMPFEKYIAKYEETGDYVEDPMEMHHYQRDLLSNFTPDAPYLESDMPRTENMRESMLNVRYHGSRSEFTPQLPDGTFLDYEFLDRDPRGHTQEPQWNKYIAEGITRAGNVKFSNDEDYTTFDTPRGGYGLSNSKKEMSEQFKQRWKNFHTSKDTWLPGVLPARYSESRFCQIATEQNPGLIEEGVCGNRNIVRDLSNSVPLGYQTTGDQEFQIASYSQVRSTRSLAEDDWSKNRNNTYQDRDDYIQYKDNAVPRSVAMTMIDMSQKKYHETQSLRNYKFANSKDSGPSRQQIFIADRMKNAQNAVAGLPQAPSQDRAYASHGRALPKQDQNLKLKSKLSHEVAKTMVSVNRKIGKLESKDLRNQVINSIVAQDSSMQATRKRPTSITNSYWDSVEDRKINGEAEKTVFNFKKIKPKIYSKTDEIDNVTFDDYKATSKTMDPRRIKAFNEMDMYSSAMADGIAFPERSTAAANPSINVGSKYTHDKVLREKNMHDLFDL